MSTGSSLNSLSGRLNRIRQGKGKRDSSEGRKKSSVDLPFPWKRIRPFVSIKESETELTETEKFSFENLSSLFPQTANKKIEDLVFYDLETTGLSGGAGTISFLAGFGRIKNGQFLIRQFFLHDFPGETDFLELIHDLLEGDDILVSYNGKSFDHPLLRTRFLMNGLKLTPLQEIDLLHLSRRLWKDRLPSCRLGIIEEEILGIHRINDIPGRDIPDIYFDYLNNKNLQVSLYRLEGVFQHHYQDIISLGKLLLFIGGIWNKPSSVIKEDRTALGKLMLLRNRPDGAFLLRKSWESGDYEAGRTLSLFYKRNGELDSATAIWLKMWENKNDLFQGLELAKYYEHKVKKIDKSISVVTKLLTEKNIIHSSTIKEQLIYRLDRLNRKKIARDSF